MRSFSDGPFPNCSCDFHRKQLSGVKIHCSWMVLFGQLGDSHLAYRDYPKRTYDTCATSPCVRLSRTPWPVVTPATTIRAP